MNNTNNNLLFLLPADITIDILSRLPVESVLQCKLVCRTWETLINHPFFGHTHTQRLLQQHNSRSADDNNNNNNNNNNNISFDFILRTSKEGVCKYEYGEYTIDHLGSSTLRRSKPVPLPLEEHYSHKYKSNYLQDRFHTNPVDSCNGLICLVSTYRDDFNMWVYNPLTTEYVNLLPRFMVNGGSSMKYSRVATGFGYHPVTKEYKIVRIYYEMLCSPGQVSVYTLGSGACGGGGWRSKGETSHQLDGSGVSVNGALHWSARKSGWMPSVEENKKNDEYIVSFDMVDEEFRIIPSPPPNVDRIQLGVLEGCLSATGINSDIRPQNSSDVWVMSKDYKWSKKYNIPWKKPHFSYRYNPPLGLAPPPLLKKAAGDHDNDNKILLHYRWMGMVSYDTKRGCLDHDNYYKIKLVNYYDLIPYMKSFASLKALGEDGERIGGRTAAAATTSTTTQQQQLITSKKRKRT